MPLSPIGVLDLSVVTDRLVNLLTTEWDNSPLWTTNGGDIPKFNAGISGSAPETVRELGGCQLSAYLFHVAQDKFQTNSPVIGSRVLPVPHPRAQIIPYQPLSLTLFYVLSAFAQGNYVQEQQAMSIALRCFHQNPIIRRNVTLNLPPVTPVPEEFTLTMDVAAVDELSRLWQSVASAMRLASIYRVGVVFATPPAAPVLAPPTKSYMLAVDPAAIPFAADGQTIGTMRTVTYASPFSAPPANPQVRSYDLSPATAAAGQTILLNGAGFDQPTASRVYMSAPGSAEVEVTNWVVPTPNPTPPPATIKPPTRIALRLPAATGAVPAGTPPPGVYQLCVGSDVASGDEVTYRSNATPFSIAAGINVTVAQPNPAVLPNPAPYTITGTNFIAGATQVLLDTIPLADNVGAPAAGEFQVVGGNTINFVPPAGIAHGTYGLRVRVNQVESDPSWWISV